MLWEILWSLAAIIFVCFVFVVAFGAPFLPTLKSRAPDALKLLGLKPGQTLVELGSGDGRLLRLAAEQGIYAIGYELNPLLVMWTYLVHWRYRKYITIRLGNFWHHKFPEADGIYTFLLDPYMPKLDKKITQEITKKVKLVSFAFEIPGKKPVKEINGMRLYTYNPKHHLR
jgi:hypothetical protein